MNLPDISKLKTLNSLVKRAGLKAQNYFRTGPIFANKKNRTFNCKEGVNAFYIAGRSKGFAVDRLIVWKVDGGDSETANDLQTSQSKIRK